jgi:hypothetical protein
MSSGSFAWPAEKILLRNTSNITMGYLYNMENWVSDFNQVDWIMDRDFENYVAAIAEDDKL